MHRILRYLLRLGAALLVLAALLIAGAPGGARRTLAAQPAASLPPSTVCTGTGTVTCELWAKAGTLSLPGSTTVPFWGYARSAADPAELPGPTLIANAGDTVNVVLHNALGRDTALAFPNQNMAPDLTGVADGGTKTYTFTAGQPGTFLYQAGLLANGARQTAMGLYGALIVRPAAASQAYDSAATAFDDEALLVYGEIDPAFNAAPDSFKLQHFTPKYLLINGKAYPDTANIASGPGRKLLLRQVNAGSLQHSIGLLGLRQQVIAEDGNAYAHPYGVAAETLAAGQTLDTLATIPASAPSNGRFPVYDAALNVFGPGGPSALGGALTFVEMGASAPGGDAQGPTASGLTLAPTFTDGTTAVSISAAISDAASGGSNVTAATYTIDGGATQSLTLSNGGATPTASASGSISTAQLAALASGAHTVHVRGQDSAGNWGPAVSATFRLDKDGPVTGGLTLTPAYSNGTAAVSIAATVSDASSGGSNVTAAEYFIDSQPAATIRGTALSLNQNTPTASATGTIAAATVNALAVGTHIVYVRGQDSVGNWGAFAQVTLAVDKAGPSVSGAVAVAPSPNNGAQPYNSATNGVRVDATLVDALTNVVNAELFIDTVGANGSGIVMVANDSLFNSPSEAAHGTIPLAQVQLLSVGTHTIHVHGKDAAGNWGTTTSGTLIIDKTAPSVSAAAVSPSPAIAVASVTLTATAADPAPASNITRAEYYIDADPGAGNATAIAIATPAPAVNLSASVNIGALAGGSHTIGVRVRDAAGNWSTVRTVTLSVVPDAIFADGFETGNTNAWTSRSTNTLARLNVTSGAPAMAGTFKLQAQGNNTNYVQYNFGAAANPATTTYDARFYFRPNGNSSAGKDIFVAASGTNFSSGQILFRVRYRLSGSTPQLQIQVGTSNTNTAWANISGTANNVIEVVWQAVGSGGPNPGTLRLYVGGSQVQSLSTTSTGAVTAVRLGSVTSAGNNRLMYFDAFASKRSVAALIGP